VAVRTHARKILVVVIAIARGQAAKMATGTNPARKPQSTSPKAATGVLQVIGFFPQIARFPVDGPATAATKYRRIKQI